MKETGLLSAYRILDLTNEKGFLCGKLLGDLGAEVLKIERPGGDLARNIGPFYHDIPDPENSLFWLSFNTSKKGITLDIESIKGKNVFLSLVKKSDCIVESYDSGHLEAIGLGDSVLKKLNPKIILVSIKSFGSTGPYKNYLSCDLILWALSGLLFICGDPDRPPVRVSFPQAYLHASVDAATGAVMALLNRNLTGEAENVEVVALKSMERVAYPAHMLWDAKRKKLRRVGANLKVPPLGTSTPLIWQCKDGYVAFYLFGGQMGMISNPSLIKWMDEEGMATGYLKTVDWAKFDIGNTPQDEIEEKVVHPIATFFLKHRESVLWIEGLRRRVMVYPVNDVKHIITNSHLKERRFWADFYHPKMGQNFKYPGAFCKTPGDLCRVRRIAPHIGEHNGEVYKSVLNISERDIEHFRKEHVI